MSRKKEAILNITAIVAGIPLAALAAGAGATSIPWLAALLTLPSAIVAASGTIGSQLAKLKPHEQKEEYLILPVPGWWDSDDAYWQGLCVEIGQYLPTILPEMIQRMGMVQGESVLTEEIARQIFIALLVETLTTKRFTWAPALHDRKRVAEEVATPILKKLDDIFLPIIERLQRERFLEDVYKTRQSNEQIASHTEKMVNLLEGQYQASQPRIFFPEEIAILHQKYCDALYEQWKTLDFRGIRYAETSRRLSIPLRDVFVFPDLLVGVPEYETIEREDEYQDGEKNRKKQRYEEKEQEQISFSDRQQKREKRSVLQRDKLHTVLEKSHHLVILGDPGAGKSTFLRYLLLRLTHDQNKFTQDFPQLVDAVSLVPLYMPLAPYADFLDSPAFDERSLKAFLPKYLRENYLENFVHFILQQLEQECVFFLFDGLDEITKTSLRTKVVKQIEAFTQAYPRNRFIVTSRIVGYKEIPLEADYQPYTLADFDEHQIKLFTQKWCPAYERWVKVAEYDQYLQESATKEAERLFLATQRNSAVRRLAVNPLLLTILAIIQRQGIELPSHRIELFDLCVTTLINTWVQAKGLSINFDELEMFKMLRSLAFWMHEQSTVGAIPEEELVDRIVTQLSKRNVNDYEATQIARNFLETVRNKMGILVERGKQRYGFLHLTFEEYFAARELVVRRKNRKEFIKEHLHDSRWREVILLTVGTIGILQKDEDEVTELVQDAILLAGSPFEKWLYRDLLLAGMCLADDIGVSIACEDAIIEQIVYIYLTSPFHFTRVSFSQVLNAWRGTSIAKKAIYIVLGLISQGEKFANGRLSLQTAFSGPFNFEREFNTYYQHLIEQAREYPISLLKIDVVLALNKLTNLKDEFLHVLKGLSHTNSVVRVAAAKALGRLGNGQPEIIEELLQALSDTDSNVREAAISALSLVGHGQPEVTEALLKMLSFSYYTLQKAAVDALGQLKDGRSRVIKALLQALSGTAWSVREAAANALVQLEKEHPEVLQALLQALSDIDPDMRQAAATALGQVGSGHPEVLQALLQALSDIDPDVRIAVVSALVILSADKSIVSHVEEMLSVYEPKLSQLLIADYEVTKFFESLQRVIGEA